MASNDPPKPLVPAPSAAGPATTLDRKAVERILARATELQSAIPGDTTEQISEAQIYEIAKEVGLSPASVTQALAEERTRIDVDDIPETDKGWIARITGPTIITAQRIVPGDTLGAMAALDRWMQEGEALQIQRQFPDRMVWEPRTDWVGVMRRAWRAGGRSYYLSEARGVAATVVPIDADRVIVRLDADILPSRNRRVAGGGGIAIAGVITSFSLGALGALFNVSELATLAAGVVPLGAAGLAGHAVLRTHRTVVARVKLGLEQAIDKLEYTTGGSHRLTGNNHHLLR